MLHLGQPDPSDAVDHRRDGRDGAPTADRCQAAVERFGVGRARESEVGEDRRLQRDDPATVGERGSDVVGDHREDHGDSVPASQART